MTAQESALSRADAHDARVEDSATPARRRLLRRRPRVEGPQTDSSASQAVLLATVLSACLTVVAVVLFTVWAYRTATSSTDALSPDIDPVFEVRDKLVWVAALLGSGMMGLLLAWWRRPLRGLLESWPMLVLTVLGSTGVAISAAWVDTSIGLGPVNLLLAVVLVPVLLLALAPRAQGVVRFASPAIITVGAALYLPALWQSPRGMYDALHGARTIDEMLGPVAGHLPLADYIPQYGGLLGLPLVPFRALVERHIEGSIVSYLSVLSIVTVVALCVAAALMLPRGRRALGPLVVVPILLMKPSQPERLTPAGLQRLFQTLPDRSLLPAILGVLLLLAAARPHSLRRWWWVGGAASLAALSNFESGAPATVAAVLAVVALRAGWRALASVVAAWIGVALAYAALLWLAGGAFRLGYWMAFSLEFAGGFAQVPMPLYGNHVLVLFVLVASVASAFPVLWRGNRSLSVAAAGGLFFGSWGLMMFPYYVGRSSSFGQLQFFFIPASIGAVWLLIGAAGVVRGRQTSPRLAYAVLLCCLPAALFVSTVIKAPSPEVNVKRLGGGFAPSGVFRSTAFKNLPVVDAKRATVIRDVGTRARQPVGVFFNSGNLVSLRTGLPNASVVAVPEELMAHRPWSSDPNDAGNANFRRMQCQSLEASTLNSVIAEPSIAAGLDSCTGFSRARTDRGLVVLTRTSR